MKKVLFVATVFEHFKAFHLPYMKMFQDMGYEVHIAANHFVDMPYFDKKFELPIERLPYNKNNITAYKQLKTIIDAEKYDIIHCHTPMGGAIARLAAKGVRKHGTKVFYTAHGFHFYKNAPLVNWLIYYPIEKILSNFTDVLITINKEDFSRAKKHFKAKEIRYVPGVGVNLNKFGNVALNKEECKKKLGIPKDGRIVLSVGELNKNKNHETAIKAIAGLKNKNIHYIVAGVGRLDKHLINVAEECNVKNNVHLLGRREDIAELCDLADIFCFPSYREGLPVSLMEAMASGLPCVVSNIRGNSDLIENGQGGFLISPTDTNTFADKINTLISDEKLCAEMGEINKKNIVTFSSENVEKMMREIYLSV